MLPATYATRFDELKASGQLPSPTGVALAILRMTESDRTSPSEIAHVLQSDPALTGRLIKLANSVATGRTRPVSSVNEAVTHLGTRIVRTLALGFSLVSQHGHGACGEFDYPTFWSHSLAMAVGAQAAAHHIGFLAPSEAFTCGLLAQVGRLALATVYPQEYGHILAAGKQEPSRDLCRDEREQFATDHNELTAALLRDWGLPSACVEAALYHEQPTGSPLDEKSREYTLACLLNLARHMAEVCVAPDDCRQDNVLELFGVGVDAGITGEVLIDLCDQVVAEWREWGKILQVSTQRVPPFAELAELARQSTEVSPSGTPPRPNPLERPLTIVVVDDDPVELRLLARHLTAAGHNVHTARDGMEGLRLVLHVAPHLVITDGMMPEMDGAALCRTLRQSKQGRQLYLLMLTGAEEEQAQVEAFEAGADDFVIKPVRPRILAARLHACLRLICLQEEMEHDKDELQRLMAELSVANRKLQQAALTDALTGLYNRRYAMERLDQEWHAVQRQDRPLACLLIDIDHFKRVNDTYGHDIGDLVLQETAKVLRKSIRQSDVVCRLGGEEFVILAPFLGREGAVGLAERVRKSVEAHPIPTPVGTVQVTLSIGVANIPSDIASQAELLKAADEAVYAAKQAGRNQVRVARMRERVHPD